MKSFKQWKNININECACGCNPDPMAQCTCGCDKEVDDEMEMHLKNLRIIAHYAKTIHDMVEQGQDLEEWQQHKISVCRAYLSDVRHAFD